MGYKALKMFNWYDKVLLLLGFMLIAIPTLLMQLGNSLLSPYLTLLYISGILIVLLELLFAIIFIYIIKE
jgi:hypothetical protein